MIITAEPTEEYQNVICRLPGILRTTKYPKQRAIDRDKGIFFLNSELQSLEVTGNHPNFYKTVQNSQNPPAKDAFSIYFMSNLSWNLFSRVKSAFKRKFSFKITLYHLELIIQRSPGDYNRKTRRSNSIFRIMTLNILPDHHLIAYKDKKQ